jgi:hypothetical protein
MQGFNAAAKELGWAGGEDLMWYKAIQGVNNQLGGIINGGVDPGTGINYGMGISEGMSFLNEFIGAVGGVLQEAMGEMSEKEAQETANSFKEIQEKAGELEEDAEDIQEDYGDLQDKTDKAGEDKKITDSEKKGIMKDQFDLSTKTAQFMHDFAKTLKELMTLTGKSLQELIDEVWDQLSKEPDMQEDPETGETVNKGGIGEEPGPPCSLLPDPPCFGCPVGIYGKKETLVAAGVPEGSAEQEVSGQESAGESNGQADGSAQQGSSSPSGGVVVGITGSVAGDIPGEAPGEDEGPGV